MSGRVYLMGAGLGIPAYLTTYAYHLITQAEVLVYDALVDGPLLHLVPENCVKLNVGKRGGQPSMKQADIDRLLVEECHRGKQVVRLKSGDPFIFGRATSEIQALIANGCTFEVVPGIYSALAGPLLAGIPLTDPVMSRCFAVLSAHEPESLNWQALAQLETLVILMGGQSLPTIAQQLQRWGKSPQTSVAVIRWAGRAEQRLWAGTLETIAALTAGESLSPAVIVIGEVVGLREYLQPRDNHLWTPRKQAMGMGPLAGKTVMVTRSAGQSGQFSDRLRQEGAAVVEMPALEMGPPSRWDALDEALAQLSNFHWLILTSTNGVDYFFERLHTLGKDARSLAGVKIAVVGEKTATRLQQQGLQADFIPPNFVADSLVEHLSQREPLQGKRILFPRVESGGREVLGTELTHQGAIVVEVAAYQSRCPVAIDPLALAALQNRQVQVITFASSKTVKHFCQLLEQAEPDWRVWLEGVCIASIGPQTSESCRQLLGRVDVEAQEYTLDGLMDALITWAT